MGSEEVKMKKGKKEKLESTGSAVPLQQRRCHSRCFVLKELGAGCIKEFANDLVDLCKVL